ncbi:MAG: hypothetical protein II474_10925 [Firmicutes bacterium]|nr:hypothetical protein [Bacillota bacterium]
MTRIFFDMDGVLAEYRQVPVEEYLRKGYFAELAPRPEALQALADLAEDPRYEVHTLSAVFAENPYAKDEKSEWLRRHLPEKALRSLTSIFCLCGESKADAVPGGIRPTDILVDDYNANLRDWQQKGVAIKMLNGINDRHGSWQGLRAGGTGADIAETIRRAAG